MLAALGLAVWGTAVANANDLYNGYLDILGAVGANGQNNPGPDGWVINATKTLSGTFTDGADSETFCNVQQPGGYGVFFKPFQGQTNANPSLDDELSVYFYQDNPSAPNTKYTFSGYAACEAEFCELFPAPPSAPPPTTFFFVEFLDGGGSVISSNTFDLLSNGLPSGGTGSMALLTTPQYTAPAGTVTVRAGAAMLNAYGTTGAQSFFVDAFDLESVAPAGSPVITNQPVAVTVKVGGTAQFSVGVSNTAGAGITWTRNNVPLSDSAGHISGSSTATLTVTGVTTNDVAHYSAVVTNSVGIAHSVSVPLAITGVALEPAIIITGIVGDTYEVDYTTSLTPPVTWTPLFAAVKITTSPQPVVDTSGIGSGRFYRAVFLH
jgi:hypothetical protein